MELVAVTVELKGVRQRSVSGSVPLGLIWVGRQL